MTYISWYIRSLVAYSIILSAHSEEYDALIFDSDKLDICNLNEKRSVTCAIACPAQPEDEAIKNYLENIKYGKTPLFIEQIDHAEKLREKNAGKCKLGYELSALLIPYEARENELVEFGSLIFYEKSKFLGKLTEAMNFNEVMRYNKLTAVPDDDSIFESYAWVKHPQWQWEEKWGLTWVSKIDVKYNFFSRILKWLDYKVGPILIDQVEAKCHDYELRTNKYNTIEHLDRLYAGDNQKAIFENFATSEQSCIECVKKYNLVLPYHFQASSPDKISCSNMTTIPLWHGIPDKLMFRIEKFVIAVAQGLGEDHRLKVRTGVVGQLNLPAINNGELTKVYLDVDDEVKKVPVPNVIYKLIQYFNREPNPHMNNPTHFYIIIVIHNNPEFTAEERLCPNDECESLGWDSIQYSDSNKSDKGKKSKFVYCCKLNTVVAESISDPFRGEAAPVDLKSPPKYISYRLGLSNKTLLNEVETNFKKLVGEQTVEDQ